MIEEEIMSMYIKKKLEYEIRTFLHDPTKVIKIYFFLL